jgi:hypothetical protein
LKLIVAFTVVAALAAGPALAQGTFNNGKKPATGFGSPSSGQAAPSPYKPSYGQAPSTAGRTPGAPSTMGEPAFKPYQGYKAGSVYASKPPPRPGAKPCETSVYVNACDRAR